jgi:3'-phosphoadenosine 5'-phosphosulfate sulfotransferase (PAPS reductase)/FAD synthetase
MTKVRHVLGISGGKDSAALAIYLKKNYPNLCVEYYSSDTGKELSETYELIKKLENFLQSEIKVIKAAEGNTLDPFDHFLEMYKGYLPSSNSRWCTKKLKLEPFEKFVADDPVISYVGIRGDEDREGYISRKKNIQSIFPFRRNIWSEDVISKFLSNSNIDKLAEIVKGRKLGSKEGKLIRLVTKPVAQDFNTQNKLNQLLNIGIKETNSLIFDFLKTTEYPLSNEPNFPLIDNEDALGIDDIYKLLEESGVGVPGYYNRNNQYKFQHNGKEYSYSRSRSGCYFCFFQQKIEWVWLYENHPRLFQKALEYEKEGYSWNQEETLSELVQPKRIFQIKEDYIKRVERLAKAQKDFSKGGTLMNVLTDDESSGCAACFI